MQSLAVLSENSASSKNIKTGTYVQKSAPTVALACSAVGYNVHGAQVETGECSRQPFFMMIIIIFVVNSLGSAND